MTILSKISIQQASYILAVIIIIFFAIAFIGLAILYFNSRKRIINSSIEDENILKEANEEIEIMQKKNKKKINLKDFYLKKKKQSKINKIIYNSILTVFFVGLIGVLAASFVTTDSNNLIWFNNDSPMIIETTSMSNAYSSNKYLLDENGDELEKYERIQKFTLLTISKDENLLNNLELYDIVAFKMTQNKENLVVVHRLIKIETSEETGELLYTFRGDANPSSLKNEIKVTRDRLIGVYSTSNYHGFSSSFLGYLIKYLKSNIGIILIVTSIMLLVVYSVLFDKLVKTHDERFSKVLTIRMNGDNIRLYRLEDTLFRYREKVVHTEIDKDGVELIQLVNKNELSNFIKSKKKKNKNK